MEGVDLIIHAGDVGKPEVLSALRDLAPVRAVRGNVDRGDWAEALPLTEVVEVEGRFLYVLHDVDELNLDPHAAGFSAVISATRTNPLRKRETACSFSTPVPRDPDALHYPCRWRGSG